MSGIFGERILPIWVVVAFCGMLIQITMKATIAAAIASSSTPERSGERRS